MNLNKLYLNIIKRKLEKPINSYTTSLFNKGKNSIAQKVGEEAVELIIAAQQGKKRSVIAETADLWFHILVLLAYFDITPDDIFAELKKRNKNRPSG